MIRFVISHLIIVSSTSMVLNFEITSTSCPFLSYRLPASSSNRPVLKKKLVSSCYVGASRLPNGPGKDQSMISNSPKEADFAWWMLGCLCEMNQVKNAALVFVMI